MEKFPWTTKAALALLFFGLTALAHGQSALDGFNAVPNGPVDVAVVQPDGKILIGGRFTAISANGVGTVTRNRIARLNPDGTLDPAFNPDANGSVYAIALQPDGKILAGGVFSAIGGQARYRIARLDGTTGLADSFDPNPSGGGSVTYVFSIAVQADGKVLVGGVFSAIGGQPRNFIARLDGTTGLADSFDPNASSDVGEIVVQADGKILVSGSFTNIGGQPRRILARLDPTTGLADSFDPNPSSWVYSIVLQADGKILVGGNFSSVGVQQRNFIARLDPTTGLADSFDPNANHSVGVIAVQADGRILAGGLFSGIGGQSRNHIARLDPTTGLADSFKPNANDIVRSIAVQADGKILAGGDFTNLAGQGPPYLARLETDGRLDQTLDLGIIAGEVYTMAVQPDGKALIGGAFTSVSGVARNHIARLNTDGTLDTAFNPNADNNVLSLAIQADGKIVVSGGFTNIGGQARNRLARLDPATGLADSFDPNANSTVFSIAVQPDGKILAGGLFNGPNSIGGQARNRIARLDATTGLADSFNPNANNVVYSLAVQADGKILAGGWFNGANSIGGQTRNRVARLDSTTGLADSFDPNSDGGVNVVVLQSDGKILVGGDFANIGGQTRNHIARLDATTGLADSFDPNAIFGVNTIAVQADGKVLVGGRFGGPQSIGGQQRWFIARLDATTGLADSFNPNANHEVYSILVRPDGKILVSGLFTSIGGQTRNYFARLSNDTGALQDLAVAPSTVSWTRAGSSPQLARVSFEYSIDQLTYTALGNATLDGNNWTLTGLSLPTNQNVFIRGRGYYRGCIWGSESVAELVRNVFLPVPIAPTPTPTPAASPTPTPSVSPTPSPTAPPTPSPTPTPTPSASPSLTPTPTPTPTATPTSTPTPGCDDIWTATSLTNAPAKRQYHVAVWTGGEMIVWGGLGNGLLNTGGRYTPGTNSWLATSTINAPVGREFYTGVWTGSEMIVWGGDVNGNSSSGGRYDPSTDSWTAISTINAPIGRAYCSAVWTGSEMIVWGGYDNSGTQLNTGGRYNPVTDSWTAVSTTNAPAIRDSHTAIWTGSEMIVWGGQGLAAGTVNTGGKYNPATDSWTATSINNAPSARAYHTAVWTGSEMIVWGGEFPGSILNTGGRYNPATDSWVATNTTSAPAARDIHTAVWSGSEMIVWGGYNGCCDIAFDTGGRYNPATDSWTATNTIGAPSARGHQRAVWTGSEMIVWGGNTNGPGTLNTGGRYCARQATTPTPSPTPPTPSPTATPSPTPSPSPTPPSPTPTSTPVATLTPTPTPVASATPTSTPAASLTPTPTPVATSTPTPTPTSTPPGTPTPTPTPIPTATPTPTPPAGILGNISTRLRVETGDNVLIGGFIITGTQPKTIILRAIGPSLPLAGALADPVLELRDSSGALIQSNDNWRSDQEAEIIATTIPPTNNLESAIVATLPANNSAYTAIVRGGNNGTGIGAVEVYDLNQAVDSKLANISTRGMVQTGDDVMIGGLIVLGQDPLRVIVRAIGPSLPVPGALSDPMLELRDGNGGLIASNDNWRSDQEAEILATTIPPSNDLESALVRDFAPGNYTAIVRGVNSTTGVAAVEAYDLN